MTVDYYNIAFGVPLSQYKTLTLLFGENKCFRHTITLREAEQSECEDDNSECEDECECKNAYDFEDNSDAHELFHGVIDIKNSQRESKDEKEPNFFTDIMDKTHPFATAKITLIHVPHEEPVYPKGIKQPEDNMLFCIPIRMRSYKDDPLIPSDFNSSRFDYLEHITDIKQINQDHRELFEESCSKRFNEFLALFKERDVELYNALTKYAPRLYVIPNDCRCCS